MRWMLLVMALAAPAAAQEAAPDCRPFTPGCDALPRLFQDLERDFGPLFRDLEREIVPRMEGLGRDLQPYLDRFAEGAAPYVQGLTDLLGDLSQWEAPEVQPNGDILIRRRPPARPQAPAGEGPVTTPFEL